MVWGDTKIGLRKILDKHIDDFRNFSGNTPLEKISNALDEMIKNGKMVNKNGVITVWHKKGDEYYKLGISQCFNNSGENKWIITSYEATREKDKTFGNVLFTDKRPLANSSNNIIPKNTDSLNRKDAPISAYPHQNRLTVEASSTSPQTAPFRGSMPKQNLNNDKIKDGFTTQGMVKNIVSSGIGGGIGAYSAPEDKKLEGFIIGALGGMGASNLGGISHSAVNLVKNMIKTPKGIDRAIEKK